jgi:PhnB protein
MSVQPIPKGYHTVTPYLIVQGAGKAIEFYRKAFGATEVFRMEGPEGKIGHAEIQIGDSRVMLADEYPDMGFLSPASLGGSAVTLMIYVEDSDAVYQSALAAGAEIVKPIQDQFYGDRSGTVADPFGHVWTLSTHKEDLTYDEVERRAQEYMREQS